MDTVAKTTLDEMEIIDPDLIALEILDRLAEPTTMREDSLHSPAHDDRLP